MNSTLIPITVPVTEQASFRDGKGKLTQNIHAFYNFNINLSPQTFLLGRKKVLQTLCFRLRHSKAIISICQRENTLLVMQTLLAVMHVWYQYPIKESNII